MFLSKSTEKSQKFVGLDRTLKHVGILTLSSEYGTPFKHHSNLVGLLLIKRNIPGVSRTRGKFFVD
jgi:hypothetical protein